MIASIVGLSARNAMAMQSNVIAVARLDVGEACQPMGAIVPAGVICDANDDVPAQLPACPMMKICLNMSAGSGHCGLLTVADTSTIPDSCANAVRVVFLRSDVQGTGQYADPVFHPPIL